MKFDEVLNVIAIGSAIAKENIPVPGLAAGLNAGLFLIQVGHDAFVSGRNRGEWTGAQCQKFDSEILPTITTQDHWMKLDENAPAPLPDAPAAAEPATDAPAEEAKD